LKQRQPCRIQEKQDEQHLKHSRPKPFESQPCCRSCQNKERQQQPRFEQLPLQISAEKQETAGKSRKMPKCGTAPKPTPRKREQQCSQMPPVIRVGLVVGIARGLEHRPAPGSSGIIRINVQGLMSLDNEIVDRAIPALAS